MRFLAVVLFVACLSGLLLQFKDGHAPTASALGNAFPTLNLVAFRGKPEAVPVTFQGKVTVINFFASWCTPCDAEMPELDALKKQIPNLALVGIAWNEEPQTIARWKEKHGNIYTALWIDPKGEGSKALAIRGIPETFILDHQGIVRYRLSGVLTKSIREETLEPLIRTLIDEKTAPAKGF